MKVLMIFQDSLSKVSCSLDKKKSNHFWRIMVFFQRQRGIRVNKVNDGILISLTKTYTNLLAI